MFYIFVLLLISFIKHEQHLCWCLHHFRPEEVFSQIFHGLCPRVSYELLKLIAISRACIGRSFSSHFRSVGVTENLVGIIIFVPIHSSRWSYICSPVFPNLRGLAVCRYIISGLYANVYPNNWYRIIINQNTQTHHLILTTCCFFLLEFTSGPCTSAALRF